MAKSQGYFKAQQNNLAAVNGYVEEMYSGHNVVTSYNAVEPTKDTFAGLNQNLHDSIWKSQFISGIMMPAMVFVGNFSYVLVIIVGAALALEGYISIGIIVASWFMFEPSRNPYHRLPKELPAYNKLVQP